VPEGLIGLPADQQAGKKLHTRQRSVVVLGVATNVEDQHVIAASTTRRGLIKGSAGTFRMPGNALIQQDLCAFVLVSGFSNPAILRSLKVAVDTIAANANTSVLARAFRLQGTEVGGGNGFHQTYYGDDTGVNGVSAQGGIGIRTTNQADGGALTALTGQGTVAVNTSQLLGQAYLSRQHTLAGFVDPARSELIPEGGVVMVAPSSILVRLDAPVAAANPATNQYIVTAEWEVFDNP